MFPYLPLKARAEVGGWELVPLRRLELCDTNSEDDFASVGQLVELYEPPRGALGTHGAVVRPGDGKIGDSVDRSLMKPLRRAVLAAALDSNPVNAIPPEEPSSNGDEGEDVDDRDGNAVYTSDSATLWGHTFSDREYVSVEYGLMVSALVGGIKLGSDQARIAAPVELHVPFLAGDLDAGYANALYGLLTVSDERSRLLGRAIDWLDLAWRNTTSISEGIRIACIHSGLEVLLGQPDDTQKLRKALSKLLDDKDVPRTQRRWHSGKREVERHSELTELGWWMANFTELRDAELHGDEVAAEQWEFRGKRHLWIGESVLRRAIKQTAIGAGHPELKLDPLGRAILDATREHLAVARQEPADEGSIRGHLGAGSQKATDCSDA